MTRILFAAGGSIGHIAPCVAVWRAAQAIDPHVEAYVVCSTRGEDCRFLQKEGMAFTPLTARSVSLLTLPGAVMRGWKILRTEKPDAIFTKGGGVTIPVAIAARLRGIPIVVHESDAVPGRATGWISKIASVVCYGYAPAVPDPRIRVTGNPVRSEILSGSRERGLALTGFAGGRPVLLVSGGSQGALALNQAIVKHRDELLEHVDIIHLTGEGKEEAVIADTRYWTRPFVHEELADLYAVADIALSRAGAGSIGELAANGIPAILVPIEGLAQDHQVANALAAEKSGGCITVRQSNLDAALVPAIRDLAGDERRRTLMRERMRSLFVTDAASTIAKILLAFSPEHCPVS